MNRGPSCIQHCRRRRILARPFSSRCSPGDAGSSARKPAEIGGASTAPTIPRSAQHDSLVGARARSGHCPEGRPTFSQNQLLRLRFWEPQDDQDDSLKKPGLTARHLPRIVRGPFSPCPKRAPAISASSPTSTTARPRCRTGCSSSPARSRSASSRTRSRLDGPRARARHHDQGPPGRHELHGEGRRDLQAQPHGHARPRRLRLRSLALASPPAKARCSSSTRRRASRRRPWPTSTSPTSRASSSSRSSTRSTCRMPICPTVKRQLEDILAIPGGGGDPRQRQGRHRHRGDPRGDHRAHSAAARTTRRTRCARWSSIRLSTPTAAWSPTCACSTAASRPATPVMMMATNGTYEVKEVGIFTPQQPKSSPSRSSMPATWATSSPTSRRPAK